jgi:hypothetical protein
VEPRERLTIIEGLAAFTGSRLESFFRAHDLGAPYAKNPGSSKQQKVNDALAAAERRGMSDEILAEAVRHFGLDGEPPREPTQVTQVEPATTTFEIRRIQRLHPLIQEAAANLLRDGHNGNLLVELIEHLSDRGRKNPLPEKMLGQWIAKLGKLGVAENSRLAIDAKQKAVDVRAFERRDLGVLAPCPEPARLLA